MTVSGIIKSTECCESIEVYYNSTEEAKFYTGKSIYGVYLRQTNKTNGRYWYRNDARSIWWDGNDYWYIGRTDDLGRREGYAQLKKDWSCLPEISDINWEFNSGLSALWVDAGKKLKVRCRPKME